MMRTPCHFVIHARRADAMPAPLYACADAAMMLTPLFRYYHGSYALRCFRLRRALRQMSLDYFAIAAAFRLAFAIYAAPMRIFRFTRRLCCFALYYYDAAIDAFLLRLCA